MTCTLGVNADTLGAAFTRVGADQLTPPSLEREIAIASMAPPLKRESCQTTYTSPFGAAAIEGTIEPSRIAAPVSG